MKSECLNACETKRTALNLEFLIYFSKLEILKDILKKKLKRGLFLDLIFINFLIFF